MGETKEAFEDLWHYLRTNDWKQSFKSAFRRKYWGYWLLLAAFITASVLISVYQNKLVALIVPWKTAIASKWWSWIVAVALLLLFAIPPLVGHVVIVIAVGMIYGFWMGCAITAGGTVIGEYVCFAVIRALFLDRAQKTEATSVNYACTATLLRSGGVWINMLVRVSFLSGHVVTALQAVAGVKDWVFLVAMLPSLPRQFATVYIGYVFVPSSTTSALSASQQEILSLAIYAITFFISALAAYISLLRVRKIYPAMARAVEQGETTCARLVENGEGVERGKGKEKGKGRPTRDEQEETESDSGESGYSGGY